MENLISKYIGETAVFVPIVIAIVTQIIKQFITILSAKWSSTKLGKFFMDLVPIALGCGAAYVPGISTASLGMRWMYGILLGAAAVWVYKFSSKVPGLEKLFKSSDDIKKSEPKK